MKGAFEKIVGKTITDVVVGEGPNAPQVQVFLVFADGTYFELFGEKFSGASGVDQGTGDDAAEYARKRMETKVTRFGSSNAPSKPTEEAHIESQTVSLLDQELMGLNRLVSRFEKMVGSTGMVVITVLFGIVVAISRSSQWIQDLVFPFSWLLFGVGMLASVFAFVYVKQYALKVLFSMIKARCLKIQLSGNNLVLKREWQGGPPVLVATPDKLADPSGILDFKRITVYDLMNAINRI